MSYYVKCHSAPYESTTCYDLDKAYDLCYSLSEEYGLVEVLEQSGPFQQVMASYTWGK